MEDGIGIVGILFILGIVAFYLYCSWKLYEKAGKPGWAGIVPIYNTIVLLEIVGKPVWWIVLFFIPLVNYVILFIVLHQLSKSFGKDIGFTIGLILLGFIFYPILALGDARYQGPGGVNGQPRTMEGVLDAG